MKLKFKRPFLALGILAVLEFFCYAFMPDSLFIGSQRVVLFVLCAMCIRLGFLENFIANPYYCFVFTPFSLMVYDVSVNTRFLTALDHRVYALAVFSMIAFLAGLNLSIEKRPKNGWETEGVTGRIRKDYEVIGAILCLIWYIYQVTKIVFGITIPFSAIVVQMVYIGIAFLIMAKRPFGRGLAIITMFMILVTGFRKSSFLYVFMLALLSVLMNMRRNRKQRMWSIIGVLLGGVFLIVFAYPLKSYFLRAGSLQGLSGVGELMEITEQNNKGYGSLNLGMGLDFFLLRPYLSMTTEWTNLNYVLQTQNNLTYGMWFLKPILNILQINTSRMDVYNLLPRSNYYNTYGFLTIQVKDFGYLGAVIFTFLEGMFTARVYNYFMKHPNSPIEVTKYVYVSCAVLEMFFSNHFLLGGIHIIFLVSIVLMWLFRLTRKRIYNVLKE